MHEDLHETFKSVAARIVREQLSEIGDSNIPEYGVESFIVIIVARLKHGQEEGQSVAYALLCILAV